MGRMFSWPLCKCLNWARQQPRSQSFSPPRRGWARILSSAEKSPGNEVGTADFLDVLFMVYLQELETKNPHKDFPSQLELQTLIVSDQQFNLFSKKHQTQLWLQTSRHFSIYTEHFGSHYQLSILENRRLLSSPLYWLWSDEAAFRNLNKRYKKAKFEHRSAYRKILKISPGAYYDGLCVTMNIS